MKEKGFTLLELLVVISIISLLANATIAATYTARIKANDAKRKLDIRQIATGVQLYRDSNAGEYPPLALIPFGASSNDNTCAGHLMGGFWSNSWDSLMPNEIPIMPKDPKNGQVIDPSATGPPGLSIGPVYLGCYEYYYFQPNSLILSGDDVVIAATLEDPKGPVPACEVTSPFSGNLSPILSPSCFKLDTGCKASGDYWGNGTWICIKA